MNIPTNMDELRALMEADARAARQRIIARDGYAISNDSRGKPGKPPSDETMAMIELIRARGPIGTHEIADHFGVTKASTRARLANFLGCEVLVKAGEIELTGRGGKYHVSLWAIGPGYEAWREAEAARNG